MVREVPEEGGDGLSPEGVDALLAAAREAGTLAMGPGLGTGEGTAMAVAMLLREAEAELVLDADALNIVAQKKLNLKEARKTAVITPHLGELSRLGGLTVEEILAEGLLPVARRFAEEWGVILVLKGAPTLIALPDGRVFINSSGSQILATAGSGDVLTGLIAGLAAQGVGAEAAAVAGVYLHGFIADMLQKDGYHTLAAGDLVAAVPRALALLSDAAAGEA
jgi:NAD(P)H-hydrate epimerase